METELKSLREQVRKNLKLSQDAGSSVRRLSQHLRPGLDADESCWEEALDHISPEHSLKEFAVGTGSGDEWIEVNSADGRFDEGWVAGVGRGDRLRVTFGRKIRGALQAPTRIDAKISDDGELVLLGADDKALASFRPGACNRHIYLSRGHHSVWFCRLTPRDSVPHRLAELMPTSHAPHCPEGGSAAGLDRFDIGSVQWNFDFRCRELVDHLVSVSGHSAEFLLRNLEEDFAEELSKLVEDVVRKLAGNCHVCGLTRPRTACSHSDMSF